MRHPVDQGGVAVAFGAGRLADDPVVFIDDFKQFELLHLETGQAASDLSDESDRTDLSDLTRPDLRDDNGS
jgi:hypothetical protein